jgi:hypothetical protein
MTDAMPGLLAHERALLRGAVCPYVPGQAMAGWYPMALGAGEHGLTLAWRYLGPRPLSRAFFQDNFVGLAAGDKRVCYTPLAALAQFDESASNEHEPRCLKPCAFIFHVSRCGSTLLTQMLAQLASCVVLSEPPVLDSFFRLHHAQPQASGGAPVFRQLLAALGQARVDAEQHLIIKLDSWHVPWLPWVRAAFPDVPIFFLYRQPQEVLASHRRQRGLHMVPGLLPLAPLQLLAQALHPGDLEGHARGVLAAIFQSALTSVETDGVQLLNYSQLPQAVWELIMPALGMPCDEDALKAVQARAQFHAKHGAQPFTGDAPTLAGRADASSNALAQCYAALEKKRLGVSPAA